MKRGLCGAWRRQSGGQNMIEARISVSGSVQGVGYRSFCRHVAEHLGIRGCARNQRDGTVEIIAQGTEEKVEEFVRELRDRKPFWADVKDVLVLEKRKMVAGGDAFIFFEIH